MRYHSINIAKCSSVNIPIIAAATLMILRMLKSGVSIGCDRVDSEYLRIKTTLGGGKN